MDDQDSGAGTVRFVGTWCTLAGLLVGVISASGPGVGYPVVAGLFVLAGVGLRIEAAIRGVSAKRAESRLCEISEQDHSQR